MKSIASYFTSPPLVLAIVAILAYGLLLPQLGFYWDDLPMSWIRYQLGTEAMARYFSTNRPVWGLLYQLTTRLFPQVPILLAGFCAFLALANRAAGLGNHAGTVPKTNPPGAFHRACFSCSIPASTNNRGHIFTVIFSLFSIFSSSLII